MSECKALCEAGCSEACSVKASAGAGCVIETGWYAPVRSTLGASNIHSDPPVKNFSHRSLSQPHLFKTLTECPPDVPQSFVDRDAYMAVIKARMSQQMASVMAKKGRFEFISHPHRWVTEVRGEVFILSHEEMDALLDGVFEAGRLEGRRSV